MVSLKTMTDMNKTDKKSEGQGLADEMNVVMVSLMVTCVAFCVAVAFKFGSTCCRLARESVDEAWRLLLPEGLMLMVMVVCSVLIYQMLRNVRRGKVFVRSNANLIAAIGTLVELAGIVCLFWNGHVFEVGSHYMASMVSITLGVFFLFISCLFKVGIRMQEEQDLTI